MNEELKNDIKFVVKDGGFIPVRAHDGDAGLDLKTPVAVCCPAHGSCKIDTKVCVEIPYGMAGIIKSKSGLNFRDDIIVTGTIDYGYTGTIGCKLYNLGDTDKFFSRGDKVAQLVIIPCSVGKPVVVEEISDGSGRGENGYGSTGR